MTAEFYFILGAACSGFGTLLLAIIWRILATRSDPFQSDDK